MNFKDPNRPRDMHQRTDDGYIKEILGPAIIRLENTVNDISVKVGSLNAKHDSIQAEISEMKVDFKKHEKNEIDLSKELVKLGMNCNEHEGRIRKVESKVDHLNALFNNAAGAGFVAKYASVFISALASAVLALIGAVVFIKGK